MNIQIKIERKSRGYMNRSVYDYATKTSNGNSYYNAIFGELAKVFVILFAEGIMFNREPVLRWYIMPLSATLFGCILIAIVARAVSIDPYANYIVTEDEFDESLSEQSFIDRIIEFGMNERFMPFMEFIVLVAGIIYNGVSAGLLAAAILKGTITIPLIALCVDVRFNTAREAARSRGV